MVTPDNRVLGGHVTSGVSLFDAVRNAYAWFTDPFWQGHKPTPDTIFRVCVIGEAEKTYFVRAGRALEAAVPQPLQCQIFDTSPDPL
jgi:hypothetical protein